MHHEEKVKVEKDLRIVSFSRRPQGKKELIYTAQVFDGSLVVHEERAIERDKAETWAKDWIEENYTLVSEVLPDKESSDQGVWEGVLEETREDVLTAIDRTFHLLMEKYGE